MTRVKVKVRFDAQKQSIERFGPNMFIMYLDMSKDSDIDETIGELLARYMGIPRENIYFAYADEKTGTWYFDYE